MKTRSNPATDDFEFDTTGLSAEGKIIISLLSKKLEETMERLWSTKFAELMENLKTSNTIVEKLESENVTLRRDLDKLEEKIDNIESQDRRHDVILAGDAVPVATVGENTPAVCLELLRTKVNNNLPPNNIVAAYRIGAKPLTQKPDKRNIMVKLLNQEVKIDLIQSCRSVKPTGLYAVSYTHLTLPTNREV